MLDLGRRVRQLGTATAELGLAAELLLGLAHLVGDRVPLQLFALQQGLEVLALAAQLLVLAADLEFLEPAQGAQAHVQDRLGLQVGEPERLHHLGLGLVFLADDLDQLVEVQIGDQVAVENLEAAFDRGQPESRAADQHLAPVVEEGLQRLAQVHHARRVVLVQDVQVQREARLEIAELEQLLHQQFGRDVAGLRLEHDTHVVGRFVAHVL